MSVNDAGWGPKEYRVTAREADGTTREFKELDAHASEEVLESLLLRVSAPGHPVRSVTLSLEEDHVRCDAVLHHGPGHQSTSKCIHSGPHEIHEVDYGGRGDVAEWRGPEAFTGHNDEPPQVEDGPDGDEHGDRP